MKEINEDNFSDFIKQGLVVITFTSPWCTSCKKVASSLMSISPEWEGRVSFGVCDISTSTSIPARLQVLSLPTVLFFKDGAQIKRLQGAVSENTLLRALEESL